MSEFRSPEDMTIEELKSETRRVKQKTKDMVNYLYYLIWSNSEKTWIQKIWYTVEFWGRVQRRNMIVNVKLLRIRATYHYQKLRDTFRG